MDMFLLDQLYMSLLDILSFLIIFLKGRIRPPLALTYQNDSILRTSMNVTLTETRFHNNRQKNHYSGFKDR